MNNFNDSFAEFATALTAAEDFDDTAEQLIVYAVKTLGAGSGAITLLKAEGRLETIGATDPMVVDADLMQYELEEGPCIDATRHTRVAVSGLVGEDERWPRWGHAVAQLGVKSILSAELRGLGPRIGALNLYSSAPNAFSTEDADLASILADQSAAVMGAAATREHGLRQALETRTLIGQAQGLIMERFGLDADHAFSVLRRFSQESDLRLREVALMLVSDRELLHGLAESRSRSAQ
ncbi:GAF and ANTAR domain-containing protein [Aeromicrobium wangtongii]|uniref:GAF and ANTAR domain-containing protein n=1 Tax=Aeromicrobium wangtongii TaxID=2969247 RepID=UPI0020172B46|nr:GAF and ANTAR domain-containing protein [Aeromicrobium wangtongii]MCL3819324.1 GAF and ANTAR domain-containing protein [Aeromicrobium wangtongii]